MKKNLNNKERGVRLAVAVILLIGAGVFKSWVLLVASAFTFFEALFSWCIFYQIIGKSSCPIKKDKS